MAHQALPTYLRTFRKRCGFTQAEVAILLGLASGQLVGRYERLNRVPSLKRALACQVIFDAGPRELFPGMYRQVEQLTMRRVAELHERLAAEPQTPLRDWKLNRLEIVLEAVARHGDQ